MTAKEVLIEARGLVLKGWIQNKNWYRDRKGREYYCLREALRHSCPWPSGGGWGLFSEVAVAVTVHLPEGVDIVSYNDTPGRTQADILSLLDKAIEAEVDG